MARGMSQLTPSQGNNVAIGSHEVWIGVSCELRYPRRNPEPVGEYLKADWEKPRVVQLVLFLMIQIQKMTRVDSDVHSFFPFFLPLLPLPNSKVMSLLLLPPARSSLR